MLDFKAGPWPSSIKPLLGPGPRAPRACVFFQAKGKGQKPLAHPLIDRKAAKWRKLRALCLYVQGTLRMTSNKNGFISSNPEYWDFNIVCGKMVGLRRQVFYRFQAFRVLWFEAQARKKRTRVFRAHAILGASRFPIIDSTSLRSLQP